MCEINIQHGPREHEIAAHELIKNVILAFSFVTEPVGMRSLEAFEVDSPPAARAAFQPKIGMTVEEVIENGIEALNIAQLGKPLAIRRVSVVSIIPRVNVEVPADPSDSISADEAIKKALGPRLNLRVSQVDDQILLARRVQHPVRMLAGKSR